MTPRIPPVRGPDDVAPAHRATAERVAAFFGSIRGPFSMLLHSPPLADKALDLVEYFREHGIVEAPLRALAILATVREREAAYVWSAQVGFARRVGLREGAIDVIRARGDLSGLTAQEREIVDYARELARTNRVDAAKFETLRARYGEAWLVELTAAAHCYAFLCGVANACEVPVPEGGDLLAG